MTARNERRTASRARRARWFGPASLIVGLVLLAVAATSYRGAHARRVPAVGPADDPVARGAYLVRSIGCSDCHSPWIPGPDGPHPDPSRFLGGHPEDVVLTMPALDPESPWPILMSASGTAFAGPWGVSFAPNLTPDVNTGLGIWTEEMFVGALRSGRHFGQSRPILPPMPWHAYRSLADEDLSSIFAYLRTIPSISNRVPEPYVPGESDDPWASGLD